MFPRCFASASRARLLLLFIARAETSPSTCALFVEEDEEEDFWFNDGAEGGAEAASGAGFPNEISRGIDGSVPDGKVSHCCEGMADQLVTPPPVGEDLIKVPFKEESSFTSTLPSLKKRR